MTVITFRSVEVFAPPPPKKKKRTVPRIRHFVPLPLGFFVIVSHCLTILTIFPTQEFVGQSHDQNQTLPLGQASPRQNKQSYRFFCISKKSVLSSFGIDTNDDELYFPYIYWFPKMHKNPYKCRFMADSAKCSTKSLSILLTKLLTHIKQGLQSFCETAYSRNGKSIRCGSSRIQRSW